MGGGAWRKPEVRADRRGPADNARWKKFERRLVESGIAIKRDRRRKLKAENIRGLSRKWETYSEFFNPRNGFVLVPLRKGKRRSAVAEKIPAKALTKKGAFIRKPKLVGNMRGRARVMIDQEGNILGRIGQTQRRVTVKLDAKLLARDPKEAVRLALAKADELTPSGCRRVGCLLKVNGHNARRGVISVNVFFDYMAGKPIDETSEDDDDDTGDDTGLLYQVLDPKRKEGRLTPAKVAKIFTVEVVYRCDSRRNDRRKNKRKKSK